MADGQLVDRRFHSKIAATALNGICPLHKPSRLPVYAHVVRAVRDRHLLGCRRSQHGIFRAQQASLEQEFERPRRWHGGGDGCPSASMDVSRQPATPLHNCPSVSSRKGSSKRRRDLRSPHIPSAPAHTDQSSRRRDLRTPHTPSALARTDRSSPRRGLRTPHIPSAPVHTDRSSRRRDLRTPHTPSAPAHTDRSSRHRDLRIPHTPSAHTDHRRQRKDPRNLHTPLGHSGLSNLHTHSPHADRSTPHIQCLRPAEAPEQRCPGWSDESGVWAASAE